MRRLLKDPLVHFLFLGGLLFGIGFLRGDVAPGNSSRIAITPGVIQRLVESFRLTWQRPPTETEFRGLVEEYLKEEVLYREAMEMGLDRDDQIIRRRMRQKLEFLTSDLVESIEPTEGELEAYLDANPDLYRQDAVFSFTQIYFREQDDPDVASARVRAALRDLRANPDTDPEAMGDSFMLPAVQRDISERRLRVEFGEEFAEQLMDFQVGEWGGPVSSAFGLHIARLDEFQPGRLPELHEVRDAVYRDLVGVRTREAAQRYFDGLLSQYTVTVEWPEGMKPVSIPGVVP